MVGLIFVAFVLKGIFYDAPPSYGWKIVPTKELEYKAYNFKNPNEAKYSCRPIEENQPIPEEPKP